MWTRTTILRYDLNEAPKAAWIYALRRLSEPESLLSGIERSTILSFAESTDFNDLLMSCLPPAALQKLSSIDLFYREFDPIWKHLSNLKRLNVNLTTPGTIFPSLLSDASNWPLLEEIHLSNSMSANPSRRSELVAAFRSRLANSALSKPLIATLGGYDFPSLTFEIAKDSIDAAAESIFGLDKTKLVLKLEPAEVASNIIRNIGQSTDATETRFAFFFPNPISADAAQTLRILFSLHTPLKEVFLQFALSRTLAFAPLDSLYLRISGALHIFEKPRHYPESLSRGWFSALKACCDLDLSRTIDMMKTLVPQHFSSMLLLMGVWFPGWLKSLPADPPLWYLLSYHAIQRTFEVSSMQVPLLEGAVDPLAKFSVLPGNPRTDLLDELLRPSVASDFGRIDLISHVARVILRRCSAEEIASARTRILTALVAPQCTSHREILRKSHVVVEILRAAELTLNEEQQTSLIKNLIAVEALLPMRLGTESSWETFVSSVRFIFEQLRPNAPQLTLAQATLLSPAPEGKLAELIRVASGPKPDEDDEDCIIA